MNKLLTTLISVSLIFTAGAMAQQDESTPGPKKQRRQEQRQQRQQATQGQQQQRQQRPQAAQGQQQQRQQRQEARQNRPERRMERPNQPAASQGQGTQAGERNRREMRPRREEANQQRPNATRNENANAQTEQRRNRPEQRNRPGQEATAGSATETNAGASSQTNRRNAKARKPDVQTVQRIKQQHRDFHAQAKPQKVPAVKFQQNYRITNAERWSGPQYVAFRNYRPIWRDRAWWHNHYHTIVLIGGGYYYWDNGYWYPAWGYDPGASYYAYNGPIYTGTVSRPPDQVIADVQAVLQDMGYYKGEVDGLLGPLTRDALTQYQADQGLYQTAAIDQPTLDSLGIAG